MMAVEARRLAMQLGIQLPDDAADARRMLAYAAQIVDALEALDREERARLPRRPGLVSLVPLRRVVEPVEA